MTTNLITWLVGRNVNKHCAAHWDIFIVGLKYSFIPIITLGLVLANFLNKPYVWQVLFIHCVVIMVLNKGIMATDWLLKSLFREYIQLLEKKFCLS